jgi:flagellin
MLTTSGLTGINSFNALNKATSSLNNSLKKLATGFRINSAADDAAGLSIASKLTSEIMGRDSVSKNIGDGISSLRTAGGGLEAITGDLQRMRELSVQAANGTNSPEQLNAIQSEIDALKGNIDDFAANTEFNGINLLDGSAGTTNIVTDPSGGSIAIDNSGDFTSGSAIAAGNLNEGLAADIASIDVTAPGGAAAALADIDAALENVTAQASEYGAQENALESMAEFNSIKQEAALSSRSRIMDTDFASGMSEFQNAQVQAKLAASLNSFNSNLVLNLLPS